MRGQTMTLSAPFASALPMAEPAESELSFTSCQLRDSGTPSCMLESAGAPKSATKGIISAHCTGRAGRRGGCYAEGRTSARFFSFPVPSVVGGVCCKILFSSGATKRTHNDTHHTHHSD